MAKRSGHNGDGDGDGAGRSNDYDVGYGKPPKHTRWKPGQSGNPRGPKKGSRGLKKDLHKALGAKHSIKVGGKIMRGTTQELALFTLAMRAAGGDIRASKQLVELTLQIFGPDDRGGQRNALPKQDQELLERLFEDMAATDADGSEQIQSATDAGTLHRQDRGDGDGERRDEA